MLVEKVGDGLQRGIEENALTHELHIRKADLPVGGAAHKSPFGGHGFSAAAKLGDKGRRPEGAVPAGHGRCLNRSVVRGPGLGERQGRRGALGGDRRTRHGGVVSRKGRKGRGGRVRAPRD